MAVAGCSTNGTGMTPRVTQPNLQATSKLQFAVGTANIAFDGAIGLNTVATFRQVNGRSATLLNTPTLTGPAGFVVPPDPTGANTDAGTNHISGSPQNLNPAVTVPVTTFGQSGGLFTYGFGPFNSNTSATATYPGNSACAPVCSIYPEPFYSTSGGIQYVGGPPAYPFFNDGTYPAGFEGYSQGFTAFEAPPVAGTYTLSLVVPTTNYPTQTFTASANLTNTAPLPALPAPTFNKDGAGGGSGIIAVPPDPRIVETMVYIEDLNPATLAVNNYYTVGPLGGTGALAFTLPDTLGPCVGSGCQNGAGATPSIATGDMYAVYAVSYDYPAYEASPPLSATQTPVISGASGQADISMSQILAPSVPYFRHKRPLH